MSAPVQPPKGGGGGLSLYANLLEPDSSATISSAPVLYSQGDEGAKDDQQAKKAVDPGTLSLSEEPPPSF
jgi:splicing factor 45